MKKTLALSILCCIALLSAAQQGELALAEKHVAISDSLGKLAQYQQAIIFRKKALNIYQNQRPVPYDKIVNAYRNIGFYYRKWNRLTDSEYYQKRAVELADQRLTPQHAETAKSYNSLGSYFLSVGNYGESYRFFKKALDVSLAARLTTTGDYYNNVGIALQNLGRNDEALALYQKALVYNVENFGKYHLNTANNYLNLGTVEYNLGQYDLALAFLDTNLLILDSLLEPGAPDFASVYNNIGAVYNSKGDYRQAIVFLEKSLNLYLEHLGNNHPDVANTYVNTGVLLMERGDLDKALAYFQRAYDIRIANFQPDHPLVARTCNYLGNCFLELNDHDQAIAWLNKSLSLYQKLPNADPAEIADVRNDLGRFYEKVENYNEALVQYNEALNLNRRKLDRNDPAIANSFERIGDVFLARKLNDLAGEYYYKALQIRHILYGRKHPEIATLYRKLAQTCPSDKVCAEEYLSNAFAALNYRPVLQPAASNPQQTFEVVNSHLVLLKTLQTQGELYHGFYRKNGGIGNLQAAEKVYAIALSLIDFIKTTLEEPGSRRSLLDNFFQVYEDAILVKHALKKATGNARYWSEAFEIAERSNATLLLEALQAAEAERFAGIPDSLLERERQLKIDMAYFEKQRFEEELQNAASGNRKLVRLNERIFRLHEEHHRLLALFRDQYPAYFELKYAPKTVSIADIRHKLLRPDQTMVAWFVGEHTIAAFIIDNQGLRLETRQKDFPLEAWVEEFRNCIYRFNPADKRVSYLHQKYANIGHELYVELFEPLVPYLKNKALVIVPGGVLGNLPFDALLASQAEQYDVFDRHDYLVRSYQISYAYSATLLREMKEGGRKKGRFLGFAPSYRGDTLNVRSDPWRAILGKLRFNRDEVIAIQKIMGGDIFLDTAATEARFLEKAPAAGIIHLATHAKANDRNSDYSYLAFYQIQDSLENELVFVKNLYNLRIRAALVVLSACETGVGELQRGEGVISLARGFSYSGAASIVTTLWSIDDGASAEIMVSFYRYLKKRLPKDEALRNAKLDYLNRKKNTNLSHPLFWAAFTPVGDMSPVKTGYGWWAYALLTVSLLGFLYWQPWRK